MSNAQTIRPSTGAIAAGARTANIVQGQLIQYPGSPSMVRIAATVAAAAAGDAQLQVFVGGRNVTGQGFNIPTELAAGRGPDSQLGWLWTGPALGSDLLEVYVQNVDTVNAIAAPGVQFVIEVEPV
jgi:hypothetical protein